MLGLFGLVPVCFADGGIVLGKAKIEGNYGLAVKNSNRDTFKVLTHAFDGPEFMVQFLVDPRNAKIRQDDRVKLATAYTDTGWEAVRIYLSRGVGGFQPGIWVQVQVAQDVHGKYELISSTNHVRLPDRVSAISVSWIETSPDGGEVQVMMDGQPLQIIESHIHWQFAGFTLGPLYADGLKSGYLAVDEVKLWYHEGF